MNQIIGSHNQDEKNNQVEIRQVKTFFGVAALFLIGHMLRIFLNFFEVHYEETIIPSMAEIHNKGCVFYRPFWNNVSQNRIHSCDFPAFLKKFINMRRKSKISINNFR